MFKKKKQEEKKKELVYTEWDKDLGFLNFILSRKKGIIKEFLIGVYSKQKSDKDFLLHDDEIEPTVERITKETIDQLSENYKDFLIEKYFGSFESLLSFITEDVYVDLVSDAIIRNTKSISKNIQNKVISNVSIMNRP